jgi:hypothetical protein
MIYHLFQCPIIDFHEVFRLPTLEKKYRKSLAKHLNNMNNTIAKEHVFNHCQEDDPAYVSEISITTHQLI